MNKEAAITVEDFFQTPPQGGLRTFSYDAVREKFPNDPTILGLLVQCEKTTAALSREISARPRVFEAYLDARVGAPIPPELADDIDRIRELRARWQDAEEALIVALAERAITRSKTSPPERHRLRPIVPQQTSPEIKEATIAMADAPLLRGWGLIDGEVALRHSAKNSPLQVKFVIGPLIQWLGRPNTTDSLWTELRAMGLPAALLYHVVIAELLEHGSVIVSLDSLITAIGWDPRSSAERAKMRQTIWRWIVCFTSWEIIGKRRSVHKDPVTKQPIDLTTFTPMIRLGERGYQANTQLALDASTPPFEVELESSSWLAQFRGNTTILWYFGDVRRLANIKAGQPSGAWAQAIGLALQQLWRERAATAEVARVGDDHKPTVRFQRPFTRRELLDLFPPDPTADKVLESSHPNRARSFWTEAIGLLKQQGAIGYYEEPETTLPRKGWAKDWLDQPLDIRPPREGVTAVIEIADRKRAADKRRKRTRGKTNPGG